MYYYVYKTTNIINGKFYIGVHKHKTPHDKSYIGSGITLKRAIQKYGIENFHNEVISYHGTHEDAYKHEAQIVNDELINTDECYNMIRGGKGGGLTKTFLSEERLEIMRRPKSEETKRKISEKLMGKSYITEAGRKKLSEIGKGNSYAKGNSHSLTEETKKKISAARMGIVYSEDTKAKISANRKGKGMGSSNGMSSLENRKKVGQSKIGLRSLHHPTLNKKLAKPGTDKWKMLLKNGYVPRVVINTINVS